VIKLGGRDTFIQPGRTVDDAERIFKSALQEVEETVKKREKARNIFISFHTEDEAQVNLLRSQAKDQKYDLEFRDYSVKEPFDEKWKTNCRERISLTSLTICMIGPNTAFREAVNWELEESYRQGKKVIGVRIYKDRNDPIPRPLKDHNAPVIDWDLNKISAILTNP